MIKSLETKVSQAISDLTGVKNAIINNGVEIAEGTPSSEYKNKVTEVYEAGRDSVDGELAEVNDILTDALYGGNGEATDINELWWKALTRNYTRTEWAYAFQYADMRNIGTPKGTIKVQSGMDRMFQSCIWENIPTQFNCSGATAATHAFRYNPLLKSFLDLNIPAITRYNGAWQGCGALETIEIIRCHENSNFDATFHGCDSLKEVTFEGVIGQNISFINSPLLTSETIEHVMSVLSDTAEVKTITFNIAAKTTYYNAHSSEYPDEETAWAALVATKSNWTIALASVE